MQKKDFLRRLVASRVSPAGRWEIRASSARRLVIGRDEIVAPLFSPLWGMAFLPVLLGVVMGVPGMLGASNWGGAAAVLVPVAIAAGVGFFNLKSEPRLLPERLDFRTRGWVEITESDGHIRSKRVLKYKQIDVLVLDPPSMSIYGRVGTRIVIRPIDPALGSVCIETESLGASRIYDAINQILPKTIRRGFRDF